MNTARHSIHDDPLSDPDYIFFNVTMSYNISNGNAPVNSQYQTSYAQPLVRHMEQYYLSVARVGIPSFSAPKSTPPLIVGSDYSDNQMIYSFTMSYMGFTTDQTFCVFVPTNPNQTPYTGVVKNCLQSYNPYYYIYTYYDFYKLCLFMIEKQLSAKY